MSCDTAELGRLRRRVAILDYFEAFRQEIGFGRCWLEHSDETPCWMVRWSYREYYWERNVSDFELHNVWSPDMLARADGSALRMEWGGELDTVTADKHNDSTLGGHCDG